jgi:hypothetical protein
MLLVNPTWVVGMAFSPTRWHFRQSSKPATGWGTGLAATTVISGEVGGIVTGLIDGGEAPPQETVRRRVTGISQTIDNRFILIRFDILIESIYEILLISSQPIRRGKTPGEQSESGQTYGLVTPDRETTEKKTCSYDHHLAPQLIWAGKAEHVSFEMPTVFLHVHERIDHRPIIHRP